MHTEDEAKTKWCPHARSNVVSDEAAHNRWFDRKGGEHFECRCIGSACMAWRWVRALDPTLPIDHAPMKTEYGFCGLSGAPS